MACISKYGEEGAALLRWDAVAGSSATRMARVPGGGEAPGRCLSLARWALRGSWGPLSTQASGFRQCPRSLSACCPATVDMLPAKPRPLGPKARPGRGIPGVLWLDQESKSLNTRTVFHASLYGQRNAYLLWR